MERPEDPSPRRSPSGAAVWIALVATLLSGLSGIGRGPDHRSSTTVAKLTLPPLARSDIGVPRFSHPTDITNPLFPVSRLQQVVHLGAERGERLRFEMTLLPGTRTVEWDGQRVATVASHVVAFSDGRVAEVATDFFAQADDGSVWHFGEDVVNYEDGALVDREGTWLAGRDGRPGLVMPATPRVGDAFLSRSAPDQGVEKATVRSADQAIDGPLGRVEGGLVIQEQLADGTSEDKTYAPGYGELGARSPTQDELYNVAVAVPTDVAAAPDPGALAPLSEHVGRILASPHLGSDRPGGGAAMGWPEVTASVEAMTSAWTRAASGQGAGMLVSQMSDRLADLVAATAARRPARVKQAALDVGQAGLDLQLRHRAVSDVDRDRLRLWARQIVVDAAAGDGGAVAGDVVVLDALWLRIDQPAGPGRAALDAALADLRAASGVKDLARAAAIGGSLPAI